MTDILGLDFEELKNELAALGEKPFRARQIFEWLHVRRATDLNEMTNLSLSLRNRLSASYFIPRLTVKEMQTSTDGTRKLLFELPDGNLIESVFMQYHYGNTICVSTQVGCRMGCRFCASTIGGLLRNLSAGEILSEVYEMERFLKTPLNHIVLMGSGEPMDNYENVVRFLRLVTDPRGRNMSARNITLSTCGIPEKILSFAEEGLPVTLALSLHASNDETRKRLMPIAERYGLKEVLSACDRYFERTGRRVSYEYSVVSGVNDDEASARELGKLLSQKNAHINLIPVNPVREKMLLPPDREKLLSFQKTLEKYGINATIRRELGRDIDGACGQLRYKAVRAETGSWA